MSLPHHPVLPDQPAPPHLTISDRPLHELAAQSDQADPVDLCDLVAVPVQPGDAGTALLLGPGAAALSEAFDVDLVELAVAAGSTGEVGEAVTLVVPSAAGGVLRVLLLGVGAAGPSDLRRAGATLARAARGRRRVATTASALGDEQGLETFVAGVTLGSFAFRWGARDVADDPVAEVLLCGHEAGDHGELGGALDRAVALAGAGWRARFLATVPSNLKSPAWLADQAVDVAAATGLQVRVWDEHELAADGFGGILGVGSGSATPPRLIRLDYTPARVNRRTPTVVLVGKGITFDTGGYAIKPPAGMLSMKRDMTGGAVVIATMAALADVGCPVRVVGLVPAAENAISGTAMRPGDVLRHYGGRTSEVNNTDAEGRLVLADALAYAVEQIKPAAVVDVATLTGGAKVALGQQVGGLFANRDGLADALLAAGASAGEPLWRLPLHDGYRSKVVSRVADLDNAPSGPPAIVAALFLEAFVGSVPWAHLDIASVGDVPKDSYEWTEGPSGFGARALLTWLGGPTPLARLTDPA